MADYILSRLREWNIRHVFAYPGDGINGLVAAFGRADNNPKFVQARHEEMAAFEATGYAKFSGSVGGCMATSGPGAIHLLNGLYDAKLDHVPVVAIVGQTARSAMGGHTSRRSTYRRCPRMSPATTWSRSTCPPSFQTRSTGRSAPHRPEDPRPL